MSRFSSKGGPAEHLYSHLQGRQQESALAGISALSLPRARALQAQGFHCCRAGVRDLEGLPGFPGILLLRSALRPPGAISFYPPCLGPGFPSITACLALPRRLGGNCGAEPLSSPEGLQSAKSWPHCLRPLPVLSCPTTSAGAHDPHPRCPPPGCPCLPPE